VGRDLARFDPTGYQLNEPKYNDKRLNYMEEPKKPRKKRVPATEETKDKMRIAHKGKKKTDAHKRAISDSMKILRSMEKYECE